MAKILLSLMLVPLGLCAIALADDSPEVDWNVSNPKVKAAIKEYEATTKKLNEQYKARHKKDVETLQEALTKIMKDQAQATDIDGAAKTKALVTAIAAGAEPPVADTPERTPPAKPVYLDDLTETDSKVDVGVVGKKGAKGYDNQNVSVRGKGTQHAISTHPPSNGSAHITYFIEGKYRTLKAAVALSDGCPNGTPVTFKVIGDGKELWKSAPVSLPGAVQVLTVKMTGVKVLKLEVDCPGHGGWRQAVWFEPQLK